jgi:hypothetical protein
MAFVSQRHAVDWRLPRRAVLKALVIVTAAIVAIELAIGISVVGSAGDIGVDFRFYRDVALRWLTDGTFYLPHQLSERYEVTTLVDVIYPPSALLLFLPFVVVPAPLWWLIPTGVLGYVIWSWRPALWSVPVMLVLLMWVQAFGAWLWGNTDMWMAASIAAGLRWGWPAAVVLLKPSIVPFALIGVRRPSFWLVVIAGAAVSVILFWPLWLQYVQAMRNMVLRPDYSLGSVTLLMLPIVAWSARRRSTEAPASSRPPTTPWPTTPRPRPAR